jgi:hypothetical protein
LKSTSTIATEKTSCALKTTTAKRLSVKLRKINKTKNHNRFRLFYSDFRRNNTQAGLNMKSTRNIVALMLLFGALLFFLFPLFENFLAVSERLRVLPGVVAEFKC